MRKIKGYSTVSELSASATHQIIRATEEGSGRAVVLKTVIQQYPTEQTLQYFEHEYRLLKHIQSDAVVQPLDLRTIDGSPVLVLEDVQGVPLRKWLTQQPALADRLAVAVALAQGIDDLHAQAVVHKDITPDNILVKPDLHIVIIDFNRASFLSTATGEIQSDTTLGDTLAYVAPEQTGRVQHPVDHRADLYALGITLYEAFTGVLPFTSSDWLELIFGHTSLQPKPLHHINPAIPVVLSDIVLKLLAKEPEARYQSGFSVKKDLTHCLDAIQAGQEITPLVLGEADEDLVRNAPFPSSPSRRHTVSLGGFLASLPADSRSLDLQAVMKAAQTIMQELEWEDLVIGIVSIMMQLAGGQRGGLVVSQGGQLKVVAAQDLLANSSHVKPVALTEATNVCAPIVEEVWQNATLLVVDDPSRDPHLCDVRYLQENAPRAILCLPLVLQNTVKGVLYLEHHTLRGAYRHDRIGVLEILATQAAIALENARLFTRLNVLVAEHAQAHVSLQRYKDVIDQTPDLVGLIDADLVLQYVNSAGLEMLGYSQPEELLSTALTDLLSTERCCQAVREGVGIALDGGVWVKEINLLTSYRTEVPVSMVLVAHKARPGEHRYLSFIARDVTDQHAIEQAIKEEQELFSKAFHASPDAIGIIDLSQNCFVTVNQGFTRIFGYGKEALLGKDLDTLALWAKPENEPQDLSLFRRSEARNDVEVHMQTHTGAICYCLVALEPITLAGRDHLVFVARDMTAQKAYERDLREARDKAEAANKAKTRFLANMSHELRTPMNGITGMAHLMLNTDLTPTQRKYAERISLASQSLLNTVNDVINYAQIEADELELNVVSFSFNEVIENLNTFIDRKRKEGVRFSVIVDDGVPDQLVGDPIRISEILLNLADNAAKFTEQGSIAIHLSVMEEEGGFVVLQCTVEDTGIGMDGTQIDQLYTAFSQGDLSASRKYGGVGLGLAITHRLVALMKGTIEVVSDPGQGTTFTFTVRLKKARKAVMIGDQLMLQFAQQHRILVVDDNYEARKVFQMYLERASFQIDMVASAREALSAIASASDDERQQPYDLILLDWMMPEMSGVEMVHALKAQYDSEDLPAIVMVTAYGREDILMQAQALNLDGFLMKPVTQSDLLDTVFEAMGYGVVEDQQSVEEVDTPQETRYNGVHVLLVEDTEINQEVASDILTQEGCTVDIAHNGREAVDKVLNGDGPYDLVLMDIQMPVMDGFAATARIRQEKQYDTLPIIAMTADALKEVRQLCMEVGMNDFLSKPIHIDTLFGLLDKWAIGSSTPSPSVLVSDPIAPEPDLQSLTDLDLPGIHVQVGLMYTNQNRDLYMRLLRKFYDKNKAFMAKWEAVRQQGDHKEAVRLIHTLKGTSGTLGAEVLQDAVLKLETALHEFAPESTVKPRINAVREHLDVVLASIRKIHPVPAEAVGTPDDTTAPVHPGDLEQLRVLIEEYDTGAIAYLKQIQGWLQQQGAGEQVSALEEVLASYDFDKAIEVVNAIATQTGKLD